MDIKTLYAKASRERADWLARWQACKKYTLPETDTESAQLFDSTAADAAEMLAGAMFSMITPPESDWLCLTNDDPESLAEQAAENAIRIHLNNSNFYTTAHQCYLDLVVLGTACLLFSENPIGSQSAFNFQSIPMKDIAILRDASDAVSAVFYITSMSAMELGAKYPAFTPPKSVKEIWKQNPETQVRIIQSVIKSGTAWGLTSWADLEGEFENNVLERGEFKTNPFVICRWSAATGEMYGRGPVMRALPDIKTANKVVELILKNASISVAGIWQADDDGVINLSNISLTPGAIIPKAVGSNGLTPLRSGADFDVSQLVLNDLRMRIKTALLADKLSSMTDKEMTATEVVARNMEMLRTLGAAYGRLLFEMITPLVDRGLGILSRRGAIDDIRIGKQTKLRCTSPISKLSGTEQASQILNWIETISSVGMSDRINTDAMFTYLTDLLHIPSQLIKVPLKGEGVSRRSEA
ncbi:MAG: head-tail connector protein [Rickettsiales bacterium]|nr:head-tail connector protein [Rickettsiales bacterium]